VSNCTKDCGDGGASFEYRQVLALPQHGGAACPASLMQRLTCPAAVAALLPACPVNDPCLVASPPCGSSASACSKCARGRACTTTGDCSSSLVCRARGSATETFCLAPLPSPRPGAVGPPIVVEESVPDLTRLVANAGSSGGAGLATRTPVANEKAGGVVLQMRLRFPGSAILSSPARMFV